MTEKISKKILREFSLLIGFGLSLLGESIIKKYENHPNWFYWGTLALVVFNSGICIVIKAASVKSKT